MAVLSWLLMWFEAISGLNINLEKSEILPWEVLRMLKSWLLSWAAKWVLFPPLTWGCLFGAPHKSVVVWMGVEERMRKRLALWKRQVVRLRLRRSKGFPLGGGALEKRPHLVNWDVRFFWKLVISSKYGEEEGGWISCEVREGYGVGLWKEIRKEGVLLFKNVSFTVGDGRKGDGILVSLGLLMTGSWRRVASLLSVLQGKRLNVGMEDSVSRFRGESYGALACLLRWVFLLGKLLGGSPNPRSSQKEGWSLANRCFLCCDDEETINHILIHCPKAKVLWNLMFTMLGLIGFFNSQLKTFFLVGLIPL
ncbi:hypothetical protein CK203_092213 [Vitis vinifera]|uniref:Reverse transcriptase zinc-binding domain-containing protein n=1 Tax=Vitis vinifera TaxID=29760 RepID=A0A438F2F4_VITVI|nr:hypothetical protein CK203_092213 [Vitis vinifera]